MNQSLTPNPFGTVYLIHLNEKMSHSQHYIGWAANVEGRLHHHRTNRGSRFLAAANQRGISYEIVRQWPGSKQFERQLKNRKNARLMCPVCNKNN